MRFFLGKDPLSGISRWMDYDPTTDTTTEFAEGDVTTALDVTNDLRNDDDYWKAGVKKGMAHYASIPAILLEKWTREGVNTNDSQALLDMVNKPEYAYLRVTAKKHA
jgi:hypothetical protein